MANEKRLIDWDDVYRRACAGCTRHGDEIGECFHDEPCERLIFAFTTAQPVDAVEVVHGRWEKQDWNGLRIKGFMACSACNVMIPTADGNRYCLYKLTYCPNCGAKMDGDGR